MDTLNIIFLLTGLGILVIAFLLIYPILRKIVRCKGVTTGRILYVDEKAGGDTARAEFTYRVDGVSFRNNTGWLNNYQFIMKKEYIVRYNTKNPSESYMEQKISFGTRVAVGIWFAVAGIIAILIAIFARV